MTHVHAYISRTHIDQLSPTKLNEMELSLLKKVMIYVTFLFNIFASGRTSNISGKNWSWFQKET